MDTLTSPEAFSVALKLNPNALLWVWMPEIKSWLCYGRPPLETTYNAFTQGVVCEKEPTWRPTTNQTGPSWLP